MPILSTSSFPYPLDHNPCVFCRYTTFCLPAEASVTTYLVLGLQLLGQRCRHERPPDVRGGREMGLAALTP